MFRNLTTRCLPHSLTTCILFLAATVPAQAATFDDLSLAPESYWKGPDLTAAPQPVSAWWGDTGTAYDGSFSSGGLQFANNFVAWDSGWNSWSGWAYSNTTDTTTPGVVGWDVVNEFSAYVLPDGGGQGGSANYAVYYDNFDDDYDAPVVTGIAPGTLLGAYFTNTTWAALAMRDGDSFAKKFGGASGNDPDWFKLTILGFDAADQLTGSVEFHLADYRNLGGAPNYIVDDWTWVDLSSLGGATQLRFALDSSDWGDFGMNTPAYFAMDSLTLGVIPEPSTLLLLLCGGAAFVAAGRRRKRRSA